MILYKKYVFDNAEQYLKKIEGLPKDLGYTPILLPNPIKSEFALHLGHSEKDEKEMKVEEDLTLAVDVLWEDITESPYGWKTYEINPTQPWNRVLGIDQE
jgi:hypothetical protein